MAKTYGEQEQRVVLRSVSWDTYERLLRDHENSSAPRFTYDHGTLEVMSPLSEHERYNRSIAAVVMVLCEEMGINFDDLGSTTFRREETCRGFEPDSCFYIHGAPRVRGKDRIDLRTNPPPDLVVEIDITHPALDKLPIYAEFGVPEVWRYEGRSLRILRLAGERYVESAHSWVLPGVATDALADLVEESKHLERIVWLQHVRGWARTVRETGGGTST